MRKKLTGFIVTALLVTLITGTAVFAAENNNGASSNTAGETKQTIAMEDAVKIALEDAKVAETDAAVYKQIWEYSNNAEKFEIDFLIPGQMKYEYEIAADTGAILETDKEAWDANDDREYEGLTPGKTTDYEKLTKALEEAADTAFKDAGVKKDEVIIRKQGINFENGVEKYEVEFRTADGHEYEYEIDVKTGKILDKDVELDD